MHNLYLIIRREYLERVHRKSFIITTILMPLLMLGLMMAPALIMVLSEPENKTIAVIDASDVISPVLQSDGDLTFEKIDNAVSVDSIKRLDKYDAVLYIGSDIVDNPRNVQLYTQSAPSMTTEQYIRNQIKDAVESKRLKKYNIENLSQIMEEIEADVQISTFRIDREEEEETSSMVSYLIGIVMSMMLYMFLMIYGQMVMTSIIEEKTNRVLEIVVSSVKPKYLMMGKIIGIGLVAITQIVIWGALIGCISRWLMPMVTSGLNSDNVDLLAAISQLGNVGYVLSLMGYMLLFLVGGYLLYSSLYAAIGSAVDNIQDAQQLTTIAIVPIILGMVFSMSVANDPNSNLAFWLSVIPFTSPMVMMARIPFGIPSWEIWLSLAVLFATFFAMIWVCAKIYRVGIFMYGKKPTMKELVRWARYK